MGTKKQAETAGLWKVGEPYEGCDGKMGWHVCAGEDADVIVAECCDQATAEQIARDHNEKQPTPGARPAGWGQK